MHTVSSCILIGSLACVGVQEPEPSVAEELEALIAKTNALTSFHLVFQGSYQDGDGGPASEDALMEFVYREPWSARCTMHSPEGGADLLVENSRIYFSSSGEGHGDGSWRVMDLPSSPVREALDELFPRAYALGPGPVFTMRGGKGFEFSISFGLSGRTAVLSWLVSMKHDLEHVRREGVELAWSPGALELRLSRNTGFPTAISASKEGKKFEFRLRDSTTDTIVDELLIPPEQAATDENGVAAMASLNSDGALREEGFERLTQALDARKRAWDAGTRSDWVSFLGVLHTQALRDQNAPWLEELRESIVETAAWARATLEQGDTAERRATIQEFLEDYEQKLDEGFAKGLELHFAALPEFRSKMLMPRQELLDVEHEVIERLHGELVSTPIHAYFDEQLEAVLGN